MQPPGPEATEASLRHYREFQLASASGTAQVAGPGVYNATISFDGENAVAVEDAAALVRSYTDDSAVLVVGFAGTHTYHSLLAYLDPPFGTVDELERTAWRQLSRATERLVSRASAGMTQLSPGASTEPWLVALADATNIANAVGGHQAGVRALQVVVTAEQAHSIALPFEGAVVALRDRTCGFLEPIVSEAAIRSFVAGAQHAKERGL